MSPLGEGGGGGRKLLALILGSGGQKSAVNCVTLESYRTSGRHNCARLMVPAGCSAPRPRFLHFSKHF